MDYIIIPTSLRNIAGSNVCRTHRALKATFEKQLKMQYLKQYSLLKIISIVCIMMQDSNETTYQCHLPSPKPTNHQIPATELLDQATLWDGSSRLVIQLLQVHDG